jgi:hypothetical protein
MAQAMVSANEIRQADTPLGRAKKMADALERGHDEDDLALMFGVSVQTVRATLSLLDATQAVKDAVESGTVTVTQARQLASLKPEEQREKVAEIERRPLAQPAMKKPGVSALCSAKQSHVSNHAKKSQKPSKVPAVNTLMLCAGCLGRRMNFEPENYSKYTLRRFAALFDVICWVLIAVVTVGICMFIEWWVA